MLLLLASQQPPVCKQCFFPVLFVAMARSDGGWSGDSWSRRSWQHGSSQRDNDCGWDRDSWFWSSWQHENSRWPDGPWQSGSWPSRVSVGATDCQLKSYTKQIVQAGKERRWWIALSLLRQMQNKHVQPNVISYNAAISACAKGGQPEQALQLREI